MPPVPARERVPGRRCAWWWCGALPFPECALPAENVAAPPNRGDFDFSVSVSASSSSEPSPCEAAAEGVLDMWNPPEAV